MNRACFRPHAALLLVLTVLLGASSAAADARSRRPATDLGPRIADLLTAPASSSSIEGVTAAGLADLGAEAMPLLFNLLVTQRLPLGDGMQDERDTTADQEAVVLDALTRAEGRTLRSFLEQHADGSIRERLTVLALLAEIGDHGDVELVLRAASGPPQAGIQRQLVTTTECILRRDSRAYIGLKRTILRARVAVACALVEALVAVPCTSSMETLSPILGFEPALDELLLRSIGEIGWRCSACVDDTVRANVRRYLLVTDEDLVHEATLAAGKLRDHNSIPFLVELLDAEDPLVRENSLWSLHSISGLRFSSPARWKVWADAEQQWFEVEAPRCLEDLRRDDLGAIVQALNTLSSHRYRRDDIAGEIVDLLGDPDPERRRLTCLALAQLGSPAPVDRLVRHLEDEDAEVRELAWLALKTITTTDLPNDAAAWRESLSTSSRASQ